MPKTPTSPISPKRVWENTKNLVKSSEKKAQLKEEEEQNNEEQKKKEDDDRNRALKDRQSHHDAFPVLGQSPTKEETKDTKSQDDKSSGEDWGVHSKTILERAAKREAATSSLVPGPPIEGKLAEGDAPSPKSEWYKSKGSGSQFPTNLEAFAQVGVNKPLAGGESPTELKRRGATGFPLLPRVEKKGESSEGGQQG
jgi:hypothetical protein